MADEEGLRKEGMRRRIAGEPEAAIAEDLGRSTRWVRKWLRRWRQGHRDGWFESRSRAPNRTVTATLIADQQLAVTDVDGHTPRLLGTSWPSGTRLRRPTPGHSERHSQC